MSKEEDFACDKFLPQRWRKDICKTCYQPLRLHEKKANKPLKEPTGSSTENTGQQEKMKPPSNARPSNTGPVTSIIRQKVEVHDQPGKKKGLNIPPKPAARPPSKRSEASGIGGGGHSIDREEKQVPVESEQKLPLSEQDRQKEVKGERKRAGPPPLPVRTSSLTNIEAPSVKATSKEPLMEERVEVPATEDSAKAELVAAASSTQAPIKKSGALSRALVIRSSVISSATSDSSDVDSDDDEWGGGGSSSGKLFKYIGGLERKSVEDERAVEEEEEEEEESDYDMGFGLFDSFESSETEQQVQVVKKVEFPQMSFDLIDILFNKQMPDGSWTMDKLDLIHSGLSYGVLKTLNESGAKSLGEKRYKDLLKFIVTLIVLQILHMSFPEVYLISFSPRFSSCTDTGDEQQMAKIDLSLKLCEEINKHNPGLLSQLELGYSLTDSIDKLVKSCM